MNLCAVSGVNSNSRFQIYFKWGNSVVSVIPPLSHVGSAKILHFGEVPKRFVNFLKTLCWEPYEVKICSFLLAWKLIRNLKTNLALIYGVQVNSARLALNYFSLLGVSVGSSKPDVNYCVSDMSQSQIPSAG